MTATPFSFRLIATSGAARTGEIATAHGVVRTPAFMPVGTQATIKGVHLSAVRAGGTFSIATRTVWRNVSAARSAPELVRLMRF